MRKRIVELERALADAQRDKAELSAALERTSADLHSVREERRRLEAREAYRFAATLVAVKHDPKLAWKIPLAAGALVTPKAIRDPLRSAVARSRHAARELRARLRSLDGEVGHALLAGDVRGASTALRQWAVDSAMQASVAAGLPGPGTGLRQRAVGTILRASVAAGDPLRCGHRLRVSQPWPREDPLVSVIVPCFNYGRFVREAVESVLSQTLQDFELIVVEGGSTDGVTPAVVRSLEDPRLVKIFQPVPTRVGENRSVGLARARGKYAVFLDADDLLDPTYLEKCVRALELTGVELAYPSVQMFGNDTRTWETGDEFTLQGMATGNMVPTVTMFSVDAWRALRVGYGTHLDLEDYDFFLRFAEQGARGVKIREPLMRYRVHGRSLTDAIGHRQAEAMAQIHAEHAELLGPERVARVTAVQRQPLPRAPAPDLGRVIVRADAPLRIAVANPFLVVGGSCHLLQQLFADHARRGASLLVYSTLEPPRGMGSSAAGYARITPHVFDLPRELPEALQPDAILDLMRGRDVNLLLLVGSRRTYELLPRIKAELPGLRVVDHLYNPVGHLASNREFRGFIDFTICANDDVQRALLEDGEELERLAVIHHGIDTGHFDPQAVPRLNALPGVTLGPEQRLVVFAGRLSEEKGALRFLDVVHRLRRRPDLAFAMLGDGPLAGQVDARIAELGLRGRLARLGFVGDQRPYLRRADVVVIPSLVDGLPLVSLEAMALGVPVVASRVGALPRLIEPDVTGALVEPQDVAGFAAAIEAVLAEADPRRPAACRARVVEQFDIAAARDRYYEVFRRVVAEPSTRRGTLA